MLAANGGSAGDQNFRPDCGADRGLGEEQVGNVQRHRRAIERLIARR
jgi:hypothetical protein